jgi:hypothetical protein
VEAWPDFYIIGAPKSGTTAIAEYLRSNPNICFSDPKTPGFFSTDFENYRYFKTVDDYLACFDFVESDQRVIGEGSTWYLYSQDAVSKILQANSAAKFVVILRNPIDMVPAFHNELITSCDETVVDFKIAWQLQKKRANNESIPKTCREPRFLQYGDIARYGAQIKRLYQLASPGQVNVIIYDDFLSDPLQVYKSLLVFLDVRLDERSEFPIHKLNRQIRWPWLTRFASRPSSIRTKGINVFKKATGIKNLGFSELVQRINYRTQPRKSVTPEMREVLIEHYRDDIKDLSGILDRDLSHWYRIDGVSPTEMQSKKPRTLHPI